MPRFFFHLMAPGTRERDEDGIIFENFEQAYLDAYETVLEISFDMLRDRKDPNRHRFEICGADGVFLLDLTFSEVLRPAASSLSCNLLSASVLGRSRQRHQQLNEFIGTQIAEARETIKTVRATMSRSAATKV